MKEYRDIINSIDKEIVELLNKRAEAAIAIGRYKKSANLEIIDFNREKEVLERVVKNSKGVIPEKDLINIYREIIAATRKLQKSYKVSYLGPEGTFSSIAFKKFFGENTDFEAKRNIKEVFSDVVKENSMFGVVPVENSIEGGVNETMEWLFHFNVKIWAEICLKISFNLVSRDDISFIKKIVSHSHAIAQCRDFLNKLPGKVEIESVESTAKAAEIASKDKTIGAIVAPNIEKLYNLRIHNENIQGSVNNFTRFYIISLKENIADKKDKTSIIFAISHKPRSLFNALEIIAKYNLNMCRIESHPIKEIPWEYLFFIDIEGSVSEDFLKEFKDKTTFLKNLGSFTVEFV